MSIKNAIGALGAMNGINRHFPPLSLRLQRQERWPRLLTVAVMAPRPW